MVVFYQCRKKENIDKDDKGWDTKHTNKDDNVGANVATTQIKKI
jgi:hypothetical protein